MKKAKVLLTAFAVFAVVGGAMAFKAGNFTQYFLYRKVSPNSCPFVGRININPSGTEVSSVFTTPVFVGNQTLTEVCTTTITTIVEP